MQLYSLNGTWELIERPLSDGPDAYEVVANATTDLTIEVPGDVTDALVRAGRLPEPLVGLNFEKCRWVEERSWWLRKRFTLPPELQALHQIELRLDGLDIHGDIWVDGQHLGHHQSVFYPFTRDITEAAKEPGEHVILVRLTTGLEQVPEAPDFPLLKVVPTEEGRGYPRRGDIRRIFLRKPAYVWGWDWGPHVATCGITMGADLRGRATADLQRVNLRTELVGTTARIHAAVELDYDTLIASAYADVTVTLTDEAGHAFSATADQRFIQSGYNVIDLVVEIPAARLWWPNGAGEQHLYQVTATAVIDDGQTIRHDGQPYGARTVQLDTSPDRFVFVVNGQPIFIKGGNWIPSDSMYGRVTEAKVTRLVEEAAEANFNCLRIWGGGRFEQEAFYDACDRRGILIWHDFMSACAPLPAQLAWFREEFMREADYQVRRLHNRACLALWCGNNEVSQIYAWNAFKIDRDPGWVLYHRLLPRLVREVAPHIPYWPTSPYGGQDRVHDPRIGDDHHWIVMSPEAKFWSAPEYWDKPTVPNFNSEYGYGGPCCRTSMEEYLGTTEIDHASEVVRQHTNTFYNLPRVNFSINEHYRDPEELSLDEYILYGGLCQGLNLGYSLESLRANQHSTGGIFWMYDDTWGENGWTIIDYYLRRKVSYYNVKRCLAHQRLAIREGGQAFGGEAGEVLLLAVNETAHPLIAAAQFGYLSWDGKIQQMHAVKINVPPFTTAIVGRVPKPADQALASGTVAVLPEAGTALDSATWYHRRFRQAGVPAGRLQVTGTEVDGDDLLVTIAAATYAHAVHLHLADDYRLSDHYFDLLPGESRTIRIYDGADLHAQTLQLSSVSSA